VDGAYITSTNSSLRNLNPYFVLITEFGDLSIFECDIFDSSQHKGWVLVDVVSDTEGIRV